MGSDGKITAQQAEILLFLEGASEEHSTFDAMLQVAENNAVNNFLVIGSWSRSALRHRLRRMVKKGWLVKENQYFRISEEGEKFLVAAKEAWGGMADMLRSNKEEKPPSIWSDFVGMDNE